MTDNLQSSGSKILDWVPTDSKTGEFNRKPSSFRNAISSAPDAPFPPARDRYHLFVSLACPWAHRTLIVRALKGLESIIPATVVHWHLGESGWRFSTPEEANGSLSNPDYPHIKFNQAAAPEEVVGANFLQDLYKKADPAYEGRWTVPTLWDKEKQTIVSNESSEIIRFLYTEFDELLPEEKRGVSYYPQELRSQIDEMNDWVYATVNNGVYRAGFATYDPPFLQFQSPKLTSTAPRLLTKAPVMPSSPPSTVSKGFLPNQRAPTSSARS